MNKVKRFFGWLFLTQGYLDTLSDEVIALRAGVTSKFKDNHWLLARAAEYLKERTKT